MDMTLEQWTEEQIRATGRDTSDPAVQEEIASAAAEARAAAPGRSDAEIIAEVEPELAASRAPQMQATPTPVAPAGAAGAAQPGFSMARYQEAAGKIAQDFSPEEEAKVRQQVELRNQFARAGRAIGSGARISAGSEYGGAVDKLYN